MLSADPGWAFGFGGPTLVSDSNVNIGPDNNLYVSGSFRGTVDFDPGAGVTQLTTYQNAHDGFVAKYTPQGQFLWVKQFGQTTGHVGQEYSTGLEFDAAGNVYVTGHSNSEAPQFGATALANQGSYDVYVTKLDATTGNFLWARGIGGINQDTAGGLNVSPAGDVYITGSFYDTVDFDPSAAISNLTAAGAADAYVLKLDTQGDFVWARQFSSPYDDFGGRVVLGNDGHIYATGTFRNTADFGEPGDPLLVTSTTAETAAIFVAKLEESTGNTVWADQIGGTGAVTAARVAADGAGSLYVAGRFVDSVSLGVGTLTSAGGQDGFISKWDTDGNVVWADQIASGPGNVTPGTLQLDAAGNPLLAYAFDGTVDFDPGPSAVNLTSIDAANDGAVVKLNADGSFGWVRQMSGPGVTEGSGVVVDAAGNVYVSGSFQDSVTLSTGHVLTNPGNGTFLMKLAFGDPPTKFYVVDDASANRTHEYDATGTNGGNYSLNSGNSAPRGAASTAVGDTVWVLDANRKVYIYDINGNVIGSWKAGSLASNATPEGIATNGTDVWIVDAKSDKVFKYAGAATRLSGSQNAASSFSLNSGNRDPKDIVTDGASLWVVNDSTTDKVFKYTVAGGLLGSWTISTAHSKPTGLTIDPANVSDLWIVDSGTDLVYQYAGAASRTSGSQTASATFALAAGNSNPQGIADPPPAYATAAAPVATAAARGREAAFLTRSDDKAPVKRSASVLARQQVFASFASVRNYVPIRRMSRHVASAGESVVPDSDTCADDELVAVGHVLEAAFARIL